MLLKTIFSTLCVIGFGLCEKAPVYLWGADSTSTPALQTVQQNEFAEVILPMLKDNMVVVFVEGNLSNSDFRCAKEKKSPYTYLQAVSPRSYYANVENPIEALRSASFNYESKTLSDNGELASPLDCKPGKVVFINFEESHSEKKRVSVLKSHDAAMSSISEETSCPVVFLYTAAPAKSEPISRMRRSTANNTNGYIFRDGANLFIYFTNLTIGYLDEATKKVTEEIITVENMIVKNSSPTLLNVILGTSDATKSLNFNVSYSAGYYSVSNIVYNNIIFRNRDLYAPRNFSYYCGNLTLNGVSNSLTGDLSPYTLKWSSLQLQAPFNATQNPDFAFGDPWHCVGFFTPGILSGLFVILLLLIITFTGICWMFDINTMDRFDDPKGKTITINASE